ncbi:RraA family protein [Streptomyces sp. NPDC012623]|uniref:RraA family protein n=1 Tax=unclassified Streptomyces TaxID=2593676 RepID=UPI00368AE4BF
MTVSVSPLDPETRARLAALPVADLGDAMDRLNVVESAIGPVWTGARLVGTACTVLTTGGDNKLVRDALAVVGEGDVLVVNGQGHTEHALVGEVLAERARARGAVGFVVDGAVRDVDELRAMGFPVFARAVTPAGPSAHGPGRLGVPVAIGRVVVTPGDVLVADSDGVAVIPRAEVDAVLARAEDKHARDAELRASFA